MNNAESNWIYTPSTTITTTSDTFPNTTWTDYPQPSPWVQPDITIQPTVTIKPVVIRKQRKPKAAVKRRKKMGKKTKTKKETYITLVLDKSASMGRCYGAALDSINEQINTIKKQGHKGGKTFVSIILFDHEIEIIEENTPVNELRLLTEEDYVLCGTTALRDAVSTAIDVMQDRQDRKKNQGFLMVLISDGQENASGTTQAELQSKIQELENDDRWTFTYMLDGSTWEQVQEWAITYNTSIGNMSTYTSTSAGTVRASKGMSAGVCNYMAVREDGHTKSDTFYNSGDGTESKV